MHRTTVAAMTDAAEVAIVQASVVAPIASDDAGPLTALIYGLTVAESSNVAAYLHDRGITAERVGAILGVQERPNANLLRAQDIVLTSDIAAVVEAARLLAVSFGHDLMASEHLLLSIVNFRRENPCEKEEGLGGLPTDADVLMSDLSVAYT